MAVKPSMDLVVALTKPKKGAPAGGDDAPASESGPPPGLEESMQELMTALESGDAKGAAEAFESAHRICSSY